VSHTFAKLLYHVTFSTKGRTPVIDAELKPRLHAYLGGIVAELEGKAGIDADGLAGVRCPGPVLPRLAP
jgi:hypothetical protein